MNKQSINNWIIRFMDKWERYKVRSWVYYHPYDYLVLNEVRVPEEQRSKGYGTKFMNELIKFADKNKIRCALTPKLCYGASSLKRLTGFYKRFGFRTNRNKMIIETMVRKPK